MVGESAEVRHLLDSVLRHFVEQLTSAVKPKLPKKFHWRKTVFLLENLAQIVGIINLFSEAENQKQKNS